MDEVLRYALLAWAGLLGCLGVGCGDGKAHAAALPVPSSCAESSNTECQGSSCCTSLAVPEQAFTLGGTVESPSSSVSISPFLLDEFEVTVGRFQAFLSAYDAWRAAGNPLDRAGAHPLIEASGWSSAWSLTETAAEIESEAGIECSALSQTFTTGDATVPVNCVTWLEAFAFCIWDGGRLPTEAEWEAAATGGDQGRRFPWGDAAPDSSRAAYDCTGDGSAAQACAVTDILAVGSRPAGAGRWGHQDLAGNVWEWVLDVYRTYPPTEHDFASVAGGNYRTIRGSGWYSSSDDLRSPLRYNSLPTARRSEFGFRCARDR